MTQGNGFSQQKIGQTVTLGGQAENKGGPSGPSVVFVLPEGHRPETEMRFQAKSEHGETEVIVKPDGSVIADPSKGWVSFDGISFAVAAD
jgi:hypothetical protein